MRRGGELPVVRESARFREMLPVMMDKRLGCVFITDDADRLTGIITDGDLKRLLVREPGLMEREVGGLMVRDPKRIEASALAAHALRRMEENPGGAITQLVVVGEDGRLEGAVHLHDIVRLGLAGPVPGAGARE